MHSCPECFQACYCNGDIDDIQLDGGEVSCVHYLTDGCLTDDEPEAEERDE